MTLDERITRYLEKCPAAVAGSRGHDQTFAVACALVNGFALNEEDALRHFATYNAACSPPWKERDLRHKVQQAAKVAHGKARGHLLGAGVSQSKEAGYGAAKPVPVRLTAKNRDSRTLRTTFFNPYAHTGEKAKKAPPYIGGVGAKPSEASEPASPPPLDLPETDGRVCVPGCAVRRPQEIVCSDDTWRAVAAHPLGDEPAIHLALWLFGPDATVLETEDAP